MKPLSPISVLVPAASPRWELWRVSSSSSWHRESDDPSSDGPPPVVGLPARACRTFAFSAPTTDRNLIRRLAFAQLEKRGLASPGGSDATTFNARIVHHNASSALVAVDVLLPAAFPILATSNARAASPAARLFPLPPDHLVLTTEHGRLVLFASSSSQLVHSQIISPTSSLDADAASAITITSLALQQQHLTSPPAALTIWGDFSTDETTAFSRLLSLPVSTLPRPAPDPKLVRRESNPQLLPAATRLDLRRSRQKFLKLAAAALVVSLPAIWLYRSFSELKSLEATAASMENHVSASKGSSDSVRASHDLVTRTQARWAALRGALDARRYPAAHLDALTRCLSSADVVLTKFESKPADVSVSGTARTARDAYSYYNSISSDKPLAVFSWSMAQPALRDDGSAAFEIKGKLK